MERHGAHDLPALAGCHLQLLPLERQRTEREAQAHGRKALRWGESFVDG